MTTKARKRNDAGAVQKCAAQHFGAWAIEPQWFSQAVSAVKAGVFQPQAQPEPDPEAVTVTEKREDGSTRTLYQRENGVAIIRLNGQMTKGESSFGGASSIAVRRAIRSAVDDSQVKSILMQIDSPGGTVAGTNELAADVKWANGVKPVTAFVEDLGASAAYWVASQAGRIVANATAMIGSIGTMVVVEDTSGAYDKAGIKVHVISTGPHKGAFTDGTEITGEQLAEMQQMVNDLNEHFLAGVMQGRGMTREQTEAVADGRVFIAERAKSLGLIDEVSTYDAVIDGLITESTQMELHDFTKAKAEHPDWIAGDLDQAKRAGHADARNELKEMLAAFPDNPRFAAEQFAAGHTIDEAKATAAEVAKATAEKDAQIKAQAQEIERLKAKAGGQEALATGAAKSPTADIESEPYEADAVRADWDADRDGCKATFKVFNAYNAYRHSIVNKNRTPKQA